MLVANVTEGADGRWTALDARPIYRQARTAGFVYQAVLRYELARSIGLLFEEVEQGHADVAGIPIEMRREFSGRRRQILDQLERHGASPAKAAQAATLDTRNAKSEHVPEEELRIRWAARAEPFGITVEGLPTLVRTPVLDQSDDDIAARVTEANATFERRDVVRVIAQHATQGGALDDIETRADEFLASSPCRSRSGSSTGSSGWRCHIFSQASLILISEALPQMMQMILRASMPTAWRITVPNS